MTLPLSLSARFVLGGADDEMAIIIRCLRAGGYTNIVEASPGPRSEAQYASEISPEAGDVWIECAPSSATCPPCAGRGEDAAGYQSGHCPFCAGGRVLEGRKLLDAVGATRIDHHQPGDSGYGRPAEESFAASSLGQVLALLLGLGVSPATLGLVPLDIGPFGADPGWQPFPQMWGASWGWIADGVAWACPPGWVAAGAADHDPVGFSAGRVPGFTAAEARAWLIARAVAGGRGVTEAAVEVALAMIEAAPTLPGFPAVYDLRGIPELCPATMGADRQPVPGTGGRLGDAAFVAILALPGRAALNWGAQGTRPAGRHLGLIGDTSGLGGPALLTSVGAVGVYGAPGKACGGYVQLPPAAQAACTRSV